MSSRATLGRMGEVALLRFVSWFQTQASSKSAGAVVVVSSAKWTRLEDVMWVLALALLGGVGEKDASPNAMASYAEGKFTCESGRRHCTEEGHLVSQSL